MMASRALRARLDVTLLVRAHSRSIVGMNEGSKGSMDRPRPLVMTLTKSSATPDKRDRSDFIPLFIASTRGLRAGTRASGKSHASPFEQSAVSVDRAEAILSQLSSVSTKRSGGVSVLTYVATSEEVAHCKSLYCELRLARQRKVRREKVVW